MATRDATWAYRDRHGDAYARTYFRRLGDWVASSVGVGTRSGSPTDGGDEVLQDALVTALESGCNLLDTGIDYRHQRSERVVGRALRAADVARDEVVVVTKGGVIPFDGARPGDPGAFVRREYVETGLLDRDDLARGGHALAPAFVEDQFERSLANLGLDRLDCYLLQRPETQLEVRSRERVYDQLSAAFRLLERRIAAGDLGCYGVATWEAFRVGPEHDQYLSLPAVVSRARAAADAVGNDTTGFRVVELPFNAIMADAFTRAAHDGPAGPQNALDFANAAGVDVVACTSLAGGELAGGVPDALDGRIGGDTPAQKAINFARSAPGVAAALVGSHDPGRVRDSLAAGTFEPMGAAAFDATFE